MKYLLFLFPIFLQAQCLIPTHSYRLICADEVRYADSISSGSRLYISSRNAFVTSPRSVFSLVNGYGQHFIQITNSANSQKVVINRAWINRIDSTSSNKALIYIKDISVTFTTTESYTAVKDSAIACFIRSVASGLATLSDGDYGDVVVSGGGLVMTVDKPDLGLHNLADGDFSVTADSTALSLTNTRAITLQTKNIDGWISRYLQTNNSLTLRANSSGKNSRIFVDTTGANFQFVNGSNNASLRVGDSVAVRFNTSGSVGQVLTVTSIDGDGRLVINPKTGGSGTANCEQTLTKNSHGFRKWTPIYYDGEWKRPTFDSIIPTYIVVDSTTANTFKVANCGNYSSTLTAGLYYYKGASPGYSLTPTSIPTPLFEVAQSRLILQPLVGFQLAGGGGSGDVTRDELADSTAAIRADFPNGIISALPNGDVNITGQSSSDLRIQNTRIQFDNRFKVGQDSSFIHDPVQDTTNFKGSVMFGKPSTLGRLGITGHPFHFRNPSTASTYVLIESGRTNPTGGSAGIRLLPSGNFGSTIDFGSATSPSLGFYSYKLGRFVFSLGSSAFVSGSPRTVIVGGVDDPTQWGGDGTLVVYDSISNGKSLFLAKKSISSSVPIGIFSSGANDRLIVEDDGDIEINQNYFLPKDEPDITDGTKQTMVWTGTGSGTTVAFEDVSSGGTGGTTSTDTIVTLTYASDTVEWDLTAGVDATLDLSGDSYLKITNPDTPSYVTCYVTHTLAGSELTLPGRLPTGFSWGTGTNDVTGLGGRYDGTTWWWTREIYEAPFAYEAEATAFFAVNTGLTTPQKDAVNDLVLELKAIGWSKFQAVYPIIGGSASTHKWNLINPVNSDAAFRLSFFGTWSHDATGATPDGSTGYANTFFYPLDPNTPTVLSNLANKNSFHFAYFSATNTAPGAGDYALYGAVNGGDEILASYYFTNRKFFKLGDNQSVNITSGITNWNGLHTISRTSSTSAKVFHNATQLGSTVTTLRTSVNGLYPMYLGARNNGGTANQFSSYKCQFMSIGVGLSDAEVSALNTAITNFNTALSR